MRRHLANLVIFLSLSLCVLSVVGCLRGIRFDERFKWKSVSDSSTWVIVIDSGDWHYQFSFEHHSSWSPSGLPDSRDELAKYFSGEPGFNWFILRGKRDARESPLAFRVEMGGRDFSMLVPAPLVCILTAIPVVWWLAKIPQRRRKLRIAQGRCPYCNYDLRGTPDRCPECGKTTKIAEILP